MQRGDVLSTCTGYREADAIVKQMLVLKPKERRTAEQLCKQVQELRDYIS